MNILITGAKGFMGKNLCAALLAKPDGAEHSLFCIDKENSAEELRSAAMKADFVFHLAGVNRPTDPEDFKRGNSDLTAVLASLLKEGKKPPVLLSGSIQAALKNPYGESKLAAEETLRAYGERTGAPVYLYRLPNAFGKWSRPNYNSAVATFCHNIARGLPITVNDPDTLLRLVYIDDIVAEFLRAMAGSPTWADGLCQVQPVHEIRLGALADMLYSFASMRDSLTVPDQSDPLVRKLYATYLSFLPSEDLARGVTSHSDQRGSFSELLHMGGHGQVSLNIAKPHVVKGNHWHHTKHEKFVVLAGEGVIRFRKPEDGTVLSYKVSGEALQVVDIPPGYTHNIENLGDEDMLTLMWANEVFDPVAPDTLPLTVEPPKS